MPEAKAPACSFNDLDVRIMERDELEKRSRNGFASGTYAISITDIDAPLVSLMHRPAGILRLAFADVGVYEFPISCHIMEDADEEDLAFIEHYTGASSSIYEDERYWPNRLVHHTVLRAFEERQNA